jgi:hypothetical protein
MISLMKESPREMKRASLINSQDDVDSGSTTNSNQKKSIYEELLMQDEYDRVTSVLSPFSGMDKIPAQILENAAKRGTLVHSIIDQIIDGFDVCKDEVPEHIRGYIESFGEWNILREYVKNPGRIFCEKLKITGLCDCLYKNDDGLTLVDFKTSAKEGPTWYLQGSAYAYLLKNQGYHITNIEFVKLDKKGTEPISYFYQGSFKTFEECLKIYRIFFKGKIVDSPLDYI